MAGVGFGLLVPLAVAAMLHPEPHGFGTHQQFGLPPCSFVVMFGRRCPTCGMTTAVAHLVRGQPREALRANVGGTMVGLLLLLGVAWLLLSAGRGKWLVRPPGNTLVVWLAVAVTLVTLIDWAVRLF